MENSIDHLENFFKKKGNYNFADLNFSELGWGFDFIASNKNELIAVELRKNTEMPSETFFLKLHEIRKQKKKLEIYIAFEEFPPTKVITKLQREGIGVLLIEKNKVDYLQRSRNFSQTAVKRKLPTPPKTMYQILVFPSSILRKNRTQNLPPLRERKIIIKIIKDMALMGISIYPNPVELDPKGGNDFRRKELEKIKESHLFIGVLRGPYSKDVDYEFKKALEIKKIEFCFILSHQSRKRDENWRADKKQDSLVKFVEKKGVAHIPYENLKEFETLVQKQLHKMVRRLYAVHHCSFPLDY